MNAMRVCTEHTGWDSDEWGMNNRNGNAKKCRGRMSAHEFIRGTGMEKEWIINMEMQKERNATATSAHEFIRGKGKG